MPSSSMRLTSEASEKRGGGSVKCWDESMARFSSASPWLISGSRGEPSAPGSLAHLGQPARLLVLGLVVAALLVELEEAVEFHHGAVGAQVERAGAHLGGDVDGGALELGGLHLARQRADPDQLVELGLLGIDV